LRAPGLRQHGGERRAPSRHEFVIFATLAIIFTILPQSPGG